MKIKKSVPPILRRRLLLTLAIGSGSLFIATALYPAVRDRTLLFMSVILFLFCLVRCRALWNTISRKQYETITGVCTDTRLPPFGRYQKVFLIDDSGNETTLLLGRNLRFQAGVVYRFYFQAGRQPVFGNDYLDASLSSDAFLGYEAVMNASEHKTAT